MTSAERDAINTAFRAHGLEVSDEIRGFLSRKVKTLEKKEREGEQ